MSVWTRIRETPLILSKGAGIWHRMRNFLPIATMATVMTVSAGAGATQLDPAFGYWLTENKRAIVQVAKCGSVACGKMVWVAEPRNEAGLPKLDLKNEDAAKRSRPICGLPLFGGLTQAKPGRWADGWLYNPRDGQTYSVQINAEAGQQLKVRGFLGLPLLGSSQTWTRVEDDRGGCPPEPSKS